MSNYDHDENNFLDSDMLENTQKDGTENTEQAITHTESSESIVGGDNDDGNSEELKEDILNKDTHTVSEATNAEEPKENQPKKGTVKDKDSTIIPLEQTLSNKLFIVPLSGRPIFPGIFTPLMITGTEDVKVVDEAYSGDGLIGIIMMKQDTEFPSLSDLYEVGTVARIIKKINLPDGGVNVFISTIKRFRIRKVLSNKEPMVAVVQYLEDKDDDTIEVKALTRALISEMKEISENNPLFSEEMRLNMVNIDHPGKIADFIASILNIDRQEQQKVLEILNVQQRMEQVLVYIKKEQELLRIQKRIQSELNDRIETQQREYFLKEELKAIKEELGITTDAHNSEYQKFKEKIDSFNFEGEIKEAVENELEKFALMDTSSSEYNVVRNYLETIVGLPWGDPPGEDYDLATAKNILE